MKKVKQVSLCELADYINSLERGEHLYFALYCDTCPEDTLSTDAKHWLGATRLPKEDASILLIRYLGSTGFAYVTYDKFTGEDIGDYLRTECRWFGGQYVFLEYDAPDTTPAPDPEVDKVIFDLEFFGETYKDVEIPYHGEVSKSYIYSGDGPWHIVNLGGYTGNDYDIQVNDYDRDGNLDIDMRYVHTTDHGVIIAGSVDHADFHASNFRVVYMDDTPEVKDIVDFFDAWQEEIANLVRAYGTQMPYGGYLLKTRQLCVNNGLRVNGSIIEALFVCLGKVIVIFNELDYDTAPLKDFHIADIEELYNNLKKFLPCSQQ